MTQEEFIEILDNENYSYEIEGDRIVVTHDKKFIKKGPYGINLVASEFNGEYWVINSIPSGVIFKNKGYLNLNQLEEMPDSVEFRNTGNLKLDNIPTSEIHSGCVFDNTGSIEFSNFIWDNKWSGNIEGVNDKRLLNFMIKKGLF